jgi:translocation and assembly module TamB
VGLVVLVALPLWLPWLIPGAARAFGLACGGASAAGYWRVQVRAARWENAAAVFTAREVQMLQPLGYVLDRLSPGLLASTNTPGVQVADWVLEVRSSETPTSEEAAGPQSVAEVLDQVEAALEPLRAYLPAARLVRGRVILPGTEVLVPEVVWDAGEVRTEVAWEAPPGWRLAGLGGATAGAGGTPAPQAREAVAADGAVGALRFHVHTDLSVPGRWRWEVQAKEGTAEVRVDRGDAADGWSFAGTLAAFENRVEFSGQFARDGWLPLTAKLDWKEVHWPTALVAQPDPLKDFEGGLSLEWREERARLRARFAATHTGLPGLTSGRAELEVEAEADLDQARVTRFTVTGDPVALGLRDPIAIRYVDLPGWPGFGLTFGVDLTPLSPEQLAGSIAGQIEVSAGTDVMPRVDWRLDGRHVVALGEPVQHLELSGWLDGLILNLRTARVEWAGLQLGATGSADLERREVRELSWTSRGLPPVVQTGSVTVEGIEGAGRLTGPFTNVTHATALSARTVRAPGLHPLAGRVQAHGTGAEQGMFVGEIQVGALAVSLEGNAAWGAEGTPGAKIELTGLRWHRDGQERARLEGPAQLRFSPVTGDLPDATGWRGQLSSLRLRGPETDVGLAGEVEWPGRGQFELNLVRLPLADVAELVEALPPWLETVSVQAAGGWTNGPLVGRVAGNATVGFEGAERIEVASSLAAGAEGASLMAEVRRQGGEAVARVEGRVPLRLVPGSETAWLEWREDAPLELHCDAAQDEALWGLLTKWTGLTVTEPTLALAVSGTAKHLRGEGRFAAARLSSENQFGNLRLPSLETPEFKVRLGEAAGVRAELGFGLAGQRATAWVEAPLDVGGWADLRGLKVPDGAALRGEVTLPRWQLEPLAAVLPDLLQPVGELDLRVRLEPGYALEGALVVTNAATRTLPSVGALRQIQVHGRFDGEGFTLERSGFELSGRPVTLAGWYRWVTNTAPRFRLDVTGTNLALVRSADTFLRGDAQLELSGDSWTAGKVTGQVTLRDSLLLRDLRSLVAGSVEQPDTRPPYFSLPDPPFADWRLDVRVSGERFLRVVTPVFRGWVSTGLQLAGTLREPMVVGDVTVPEGRVVFPFGALGVDQARVSLTREDPYRPRLQVRASGRNFGYDLRLDVSGSAESPNFVFGSVPPLTSTQVLLMLTTGDIPSQSYSYSTRGRLQNIGMFIGREFLGQLTGDPESDRLTMRSGEEVTDRGQLTYRIEYRLTPTWSLFGAQDRFDSYNGGVIWTIYAK